MDINSWVNCDKINVLMTVIFPIGVKKRCRHEFRLCFTLSIAFS